MKGSELLTTILISLLAICHAQYKRMTVELVNEIPATTFRTPKIALDNQKGNHRECFASLSYKESGFFVVSSSTSNGDIKGVLSFVIPAYNVEYFHFSFELNSSASIYNVATDHLEEVNNQTNWKQIQNSSWDEKTFDNNLVVSIYHSTDNSKYVKILIRRKTQFLITQGTIKIRDLYLGCGQIGTSNNVVKDREMTQYVLAQNTNDKWQTFKFVHIRDDVYKILCQSGFKPSDKEWAAVAVPSTTTIDSGSVKFTEETDNTLSLWQISKTSFGLYTIKSWAGDLFFTNGETATLKPTTLEKESLTGIQQFYKIEYQA